jgi:CheY-like chemotaxis protein
MDWTKVKTILVIDDEIEDQKNITSTIHSFGFNGEFFYSKNNEESQRYILDLCNQNRSLDLIISAWHLQGNQKGIEVLNFLSKQLPNKKIPIVFVTNESSSSAIVESLSLGANSFLIRPWDNLKLLDHIQQAWYKIYPDDNPQKSRIEMLKKNRG